MIQNRNLEVIRSSTFFGISKNVAFVSSFDDETIAEKLMKATLNRRLWLLTVCEKHL